MTNKKNVKKTFNRQCHCRTQIIFTHPIYFNNKGQTYLQSNIYFYKTKQENSFTIYYHSEWDISRRYISFNNTLQESVIIRKIRCSTLPFIFSSRRINLKLTIFMGLRNIFVFYIKLSHDEDNNRLLVINDP